MSKGYLPASDADLLGWAGPFSDKITAQPVLYGLTPLIATTYAAKLLAFSDALTASTDPATRGPSTVKLKDEKKKDLTTYTRQIVRTIQGVSALTPAQKFDLGISPRDTPHTPIPVPDVQPVLEISERLGTMVRVRMHDGTGRRSRPVGARAANIYSHVGPTAPVQISDWTYEGESTRAFVDISFPADTAPGTVVWFTAQWKNPRGEAGPGCAPVSAIIAGGAMTMEEAA